MTVFGAVRTIACSGPKEFGFVVVCGVIAGLASVPAVWLAKLLVDGLAGEPQLTPSAAAGLAAFAALLVMASTQVTYLSAIAGTSLEAKSKLTTESALVNATTRYTGTEFLDNPESLDKLTMARRGAADAPGQMPGAIVEVVSAVAAFGGYGVLLWHAWPPMVIAMLAVAFPTAYLQTIVGRSASDILQAGSSSHRWHEYFGKLFTDPTSARDMRLHGAEPYFLERFTGALRKAQEAEVRAVKRSTTTRIALVSVHGLVAAAGAGILAAATARGMVTVGDFVLFTGSVAAIQTSAVSLLNLQSELALTMPMFRHYQEFVANAPKSRELPNGTVPALRKGIAFEHVWFRYSESTPWVLRDLSLQIPAGATIGLVGGNGEGKSTIIRLLLRYNAPTRGRILWDGVDICTMNPRDYRRNVTGVLQDRPRYELPFADNVSLGRDIGSNHADTLGRAVEAAGIERLVGALPQGGTTLLSAQRQDSEGRDGVTLSGGQWDRLALARAIYQRDPEDSRQLIVLDEPNAGLDALSEADLMTRLSNLHNKATRIIVSHRLSLVRKVDWIAVIKHGGLDEFGSPNDLISAGGEFHDLYTLQASAYLVPGQPNVTR